MADSKPFKPFENWKSDFYRLFLSASLAQVALSLTEQARNRGQALEPADALEQALKLVLSASPLVDRQLRLIAEADSDNASTPA